MTRAVPKEVREKIIRSYELGVGTIDEIALIIWADRNFNDSWFEGEYVQIKQNQWEVLLNQLARTG